MGMTSGMRKQATAPKANTMATPVAKVVTFSVINSIDVLQFQNRQLEQKMPRWQEK